MKNLFALLLTLCVTVGCNSSEATQVVSLEVPGIHCTSCAGKITEVLGELDFVQNVNVNVETKKVNLTVTKNIMNNELVLATLKDCQFTKAAFTSAE